jgi:hypothetical protein
LEETSATAEEFSSLKIPEIPSVVILTMNIPYPDVIPVSTTSFRLKAGFDPDTP